MRCWSSLAPVHPNGTTLLTNFPMNPKISHDISGGIWWESCCKRIICYPTILQFCLTATKVNPKKSYPNFNFVHTDWNKKVSAPYKHTLEMQITYSQNIIGEDGQNFNWRYWANPTILQMSLSSRRLPRTNTKTSW